MKSKSLFFGIITGFMVALSFNAFSQTDPAQTKEYSVVYFRVYYQANQLVYDINGLAKSPSLQMPDGTIGLYYDLKKMYSDDPQAKFKGLAAALNYAASYGWEVKSTNVIQYSAERRNSSEAFDTGAYLHIVIFERPYSGMKPKK